MCSPYLYIFLVFFRLFCYIVHMCLHGFMTKLSSIYMYCYDNQGNVPADVNLLPGQLRDVRHAVHQVPAPALPPSTVRHRPQHVQDPSQRHVTPRRSSPELPPVPTSPPPPPPATTTASTSADVGVDESRLPLVDYDADEDDEVRAYAIGDGRVSVRLCNGIAK